MAKTTIAIICDCDDTLAPDTTAQLLAAFDIDATEFYEIQCKSLIDAGWDPTLAYLNKMIERATPGGRLTGLTRRRMREIGESLRLFPGVPAVFGRLREEIEDGSKYRPYGIRIEIYIITGGIEELISARFRPEGGKPKTRPKNYIDWIWGCNFSFAEPDGPICKIKNVVSFTEKTKFIFCVQKGLVGPKYVNRPYDVNKQMDPDERKIPFANMVYVGDGPSDVPCMSLLSKDYRDRGCVVGIENKNRMERTWEIGYGRRVDAIADPDYRKMGSGYLYLRKAVVQIADRIVEDIEREQRRGLAPKH